MQDLMAQGFIRARIDGEVYELDQPPKLDLRRKHTIEAIVDRFRVKDDIRLRLAESFETALRIADARKKSSSPTASPATSAVTASRNSNRVCSPSTTRQGPARPVTGSASSNSLIRSESSSTGRSLSPAARSGAGIAARRITTR
jgi:excinuclease UvrABC ATPase subunit